MLLINDTDALARQRRWSEMESTEEQMAAWMRRELMFSECIDDPDTSPLNTMRKYGKPMAHSEMEKRLLKLNSNLHFVWSNINITGTQAKYAYLKTGKAAPNDLVQLFGYDSGMMPERSMWRSEVIWIPDPKHRASKFDDDIRDFEPIPRSDDDIAEIMDMLGVVYERTAEGSNPSWGAVKDTNYWWVYFDLKRKTETSGRAGWERHVRPVAESIRGWRTCVLKCVHAKVITAAQAEREFLNDNTPEWKQHMGRGPFTRPW